MRVEEKPAGAYATSAEGPTGIASATPGPTGMAGATPSPTGMASATPRPTGMAGASPSGGSTTAAGRRDPLWGLSKPEKRKRRREMKMEKQKLERTLALAQAASQPGVAPTEEVIRQLFATSPEAVEYFRSFLPPRVGG